MKVKTERTTVQHTRIQLTGRDILRMLAASKRLKITKGTTVTFTVPTGGDWSGMMLDIDNSNPITVSSKSYDHRSGAPDKS